MSYHFKASLLRLNNICVSLPCVCVCVSVFFNKWILLGVSIWKEGSCWLTIVRLCSQTNANIYLYSQHPFCFMNILQFFCSLKSELSLKKIVFLDWTLIEFNVVGSYKLEELACSSNTFTSQFHYVNILK